MGRRPRRSLLGAMAAVLGAAALLPAVLGGTADASPATTQTRAPDLATDLAGLHRGPQRPERHARRRLAEHAGRACK